jgi:hypothetical protein
MTRMNRRGILAALGACCAVPFLPKLVNAEYESVKLWSLCDLPVRPLPDCMHYKVFNVQSTSQFVEAKMPNGDNILVHCHLNGDAGKYMHELIKWDPDFKKGTGYLYIITHKNNGKYYKNVLLTRDEALGFVPVIDSPGLKGRRELRKILKNS